MGERYATPQVRDESVLLNLPWNETEGAFVVSSRRQPVS